MTDKELRKLRRTELLELLIAQGKEYAALQDKLAQTEKAMQNREMTIREAGSMADAAAEINDLIGTAQRSVDLYTENIYRVCLEQEAKAAELLSEAQAYAEKTVADADERVEMLMNGARDSALEILHDAQEKARKITDEANEKAELIREKAEQERDAILQQAEQDAEWIRSRAEEADVDFEAEDNRRRRSFWKRSR